MKRVIYLTTAVIVLAALALTGCAPKSAQPANRSAGAAGTDMAPLTQDYENALPVLNQLVVGTFKLEGTDQAINAEQAAKLLPLWKGYRGMSGGSSSSPVEMQALLKQIRGAMREEQLKAIAAMQLTGDDMMQLMQERGIEMTDRGSGASGAASTATRQAERPAIGGGGPGGGPGGAPGGGGGRGGGGSAPPQPPGGGMPPGGDQGMGPPPGMSTPGAQQPGMGARRIPMPPPLYDALIELLKSKV
jgi:hypothetical protein